MEYLINVKENCDSHFVMMLMSLDRGAILKKVKGLGGLYRVSTSLSQSELSDLTSVEGGVF